MKYTSKNIFLLSICISCCLFKNAYAYSYSDEYTQCISTPDISEDMQFNCIKMENVKIIRELELLKEKLQSSGVFSEIISNGNTLDKQLENWLGYVNNFCEYYTDARPCPEDGIPTVIREECKFNFNSSLLDNWQGLVKAISKKQLTQ